MKRNLVIGLAAAAVIAAAVGGTFGVRYMTSPTTYDECMLAEMRGQTQAMYATARTACERRHDVEVSIWITKDDWRWRNDGPFTIVTLSDAILAQYTPTRAQFAYSMDTCENTDVSAMEEHIPSFAKDGGFQLGIIAPSDPKCLRFIDLWGTRK
ncbi:hypothetical protein [Devosia salina]|uniref:Uncharacterized protein n=1 Tax=Devosia salina TaxID=2860336 RepID=A0ABX8WFV6_9HYPH|nr:hypothetical protein [Devosia salina]QYO75607.1 hypothetical protein K1X15_13305 [Devosia salina]